MTAMHRIGEAVVAIAVIPERGDARADRREREREAVRLLLGDLGVDAGELDHDAHGAPMLPGRSVSISHSMFAAAVAIGPAETRLGIDAEEYRPALRRVAQRYLTEEEQGRITEDFDLLCAWTIKEAVYKAAGEPALPLSAIVTNEALTQATTPSGGVFGISFITYGPTLVALAVGE